MCPLVTSRDIRTRQVGREPGPLDLSTRRLTEWACFVSTTELLQQRRPRRSRLRTMGILEIVIIVIVILAVLGYFGRGRLRR
jgi:predicted nucleic acid-binding Zn ribbon protein